jgi:cell division septation protein DedD
MRSPFGRYTHVPLALASVLVLVLLIAWLLARQVDGLWRAAPPSVAVVPIAAGPSGDAAPSVLAPATGPPGRPVARPAAPRFALESGPFASPEEADRLEERLNHLGHATVRFRKQEVTRLYVVSLGGFASADEASRIARELGRGVVAATDGGAEVLIDRLLSLGEAVAAARPLRDQGWPVRVTEGLSPTVIYHVRYGQFDSRADAEALGREVARDGIRGQVVKVR